MGWSSAGGHRGTLIWRRSPRCTLYLWGEKQSVGETREPGLTGWECWEGPEDQWSPLFYVDEETGSERRNSLDAELASGSTFRAQCQRHPLCDIFPWVGRCSRISRLRSQTDLGFRCGSATYPLREHGQCLCLERLSLHSWKMEVAMPSLLVVQGGGKEMNVRGPALRLAHSKPFKTDT